MCQSMVDIQPAATEIRRGKKRKKKKIEGKKLQGKNIMAPLLHRAAIIITESTSKLTLHPEEKKEFHKMLVITT